MIFSLFETVKLSVSISPRNFYNSLNSIKDIGFPISKLLHITSNTVQCGRKRLPVHHHRADYVFCSSEIIEFIYIQFKSRFLLNPVLEGVVGFAHYSTVMNRLISAECAVFVFIPWCISRFQKLELFRTIDKCSRKTHMANRMNSSFANK